MISNESNQKNISKTLESRKTLIELFLVAAVLTTGINLLTLYFDRFDKEIRVIIGLTIIFIVFGYLILKLLSSRNSEIIINGVVCIDRKTNLLCKIPSYQFSRELYDIINAGFLENPALKQQWLDDPLNTKTIQNKTDDSANTNVLNFTKPSLDENKIEDIQYYALSVSENSKNEIDEKKNSDSSKILIESIEFLILDNLSTHLANHFKNYDKRNNIQTNKNCKLIEFTIQDLPKLKSSNRFIDTLCKDIKDRVIFQNINSGKRFLPDQISSIHGSDGSMYKVFKLILPYESRILRTKQNNIRLQNSRLILDFSIDFKKFNYLLPIGFAKGYLPSEFQDVTAFKVAINLKVKMRIFSLFTFREWNYYLWQESFINHLNSQINFKYFLDKIDWDSASTNIHITQNLIRNQKRNKLIKPKPPTE